MIEAKQKELIKLIGILDEDKDYTELKEDDIHNLDHANLDDLIRQVKVLSDYYVKHKLLYGKIPFSIDVDIVKEQSYISINNIYSKVIIPGEIQEVYIGRQLVDNIQGRNNIKIDLRDVKSVNFDDCITSIHFRDAIIKDIIILNNSQLYMLELKLLHSYLCSNYSLLNIVYYIIEYHIKRLSCNDTVILKKLKLSKSLLTSAKGLAEREKMIELNQSYIDLVDTLHKWSKQHNVN